MRRYTSRVGTGLHDEDVSGSWVRYEDARALLARAESAEKERDALLEEARVVRLTPKTSAWGTGEQEIES